MIEAIKNKRDIHSLFTLYFLSTILRPLNQEIFYHDHSLSTRRV